MKKSQHNLYLLLTALASASGLVACNQDPYKNAIGPNQRTSINKPQREGNANLSIDAPAKLECVESVPCTTKVVGYALGSAGAATLTFEGLPADAVYDAKKQVLTYTPNFDVVNVASNPNQTSKDFNVVMRAMVASNPKESIEQTLIITVTNKLRPTILNISEQNPTVNEGDTIEQEVTISNPDFPNGPFFLSAKNAPAGTEIFKSSSSDSSYRIKFRTNFLNVMNSYSGSDDLFVTYAASAPLGSFVELNSRWTIKDVRQEPTVTAPESLSQGLDVNFTIFAEDRNGERAPEIRVDSSNIPFGVITTEVLSTKKKMEKSIYPSTLLKVRWDQLKTSNLGTTTAIPYEVCVWSYKNQKKSRDCISKTTNVTLTANLHPAPLVDRSSWMAGKLNYTRLGTEFKTVIPIFDSEDSSLPVDVKVMPESMRSQVNWEQGDLVVNPQAEGLIQFSIVAESVYGQVTTENFVMEVLPTAWGHSVIMASENMTNEALALSKALPMSDLLSMKYQTSERNFALRDSVILATESLNSSLLTEYVSDQVYNHVSSIVVSSPLLGSKLNGKLAATLSDLGIKIKGRFADLEPTLDVTKTVFAIDPNSGLTQPQVTPQLSGTLTAESKSPLIFDLSQASSSCRPLFKFSIPLKSLPLGVQCSLSDGKKITFLGFEIADLAFAPEDSGMIANWIQSLTANKGKH